MQERGNYVGLHDFSPREWWVRRRRPHRAKNKSPDLRERSGLIDPTAIHFHAKYPAPLVRVSGSAGEEI